VQAALASACIAIEACTGLIGSSGGIQPIQSVYP